MNEVNLVENYFRIKYPEKKVSNQNILYHKRYIWRKREQSLYNRIYRYANETSENA